MTLWWIFQQLNSSRIKQHCIARFESEDRCDLLVGFRRSLPSTVESNSSVCAPRDSSETRGNSRLSKTGLHLIVPSELCRSSCSVDSRGPIKSVAHDSIPIGHKRLTIIVWCWNNYRKCHFRAWSVFAYISLLKLSCLQVRSAIGSKSLIALPIPSWSVSSSSFRLSVRCLNTADPSLILLCISVEEE